MIALTKRNATMGLGYFLPSTYGAIAGQNQADQGAAFRLAIAAMPARGGVLYIDNEYTVNSEVVLDRPVTVLGAGGNMDFVNRTAPSRVLSYSATATSIFKVDAGGCTFKDLSIENWGTTVPTAGAGILITNGRGLAPLDSITEYYGGFRMSNVAVTGFYDNISIINAYTWGMSGMYICRHVRYGISIENRQLKDGGDANISDSFIFAGGQSSVAGVFQASSGGLKMSNVKFNSSAGNTTRMQYGYYGNLLSGATSILVINGSSFENLGVSAIYCHHYSLVTISDCEFAMYTGGGAVVDLGNVNNCVVSDNTFQGVNGGSRTIISALNSAISYKGLASNSFQNVAGLKVDITGSVDTCLTGVAAIDGAAGTAAPAPTQPAGQTNTVAPVGGFGTLPPNSVSYYVQYKDVVNATYSQSGFQITSTLAAASTTAWPATAKSTLAISKTATPGLQGRIRSTGIAFALDNDGIFDAVFADNADPNVDLYGLFFSGNLAAAYVHEGPITGASPKAAASGTVRMEIDLYDTKVEYRVNDVLLSTTTANPFANGPLSLKLFLRAAANIGYFNNMIIEGNLVTSLV